jgi:hypothetical protein
MIRNSYCLHALSQSGKGRNVFATRHGSPDDVENQQSLIIRSQDLKLQAAFFLTPAVHQWPGLNPHPKRSHSLELEGQREARNRQA